VNEGADTSRFIEPNMAIDHVRRVARETAKESGYDAAATALLALYREYRVMPLRRKETPPERLSTWEAVREETRSLVPMAMGGSTDRSLFDQRVATPADQPLPLRDRSPGPSLARQAGVLRATTTALRLPRGTSQGSAVDRTPAR
jgi:hypothetical protein